MYRSGISPRKWGRKPHSQDHVEMALDVKIAAAAEHVE